MRVVDLISPNAMASGFIRATLFPLYPTKYDTNNLVPIVQFVFNRLRQEIKT